MKFENKLLEDRWQGIEASGKQKAKVLVAIITSESNYHCQDKFLGNIMFMKGYYDVVMFENSETVENFERLRNFTHNYFQAMVKRGKTGFTSVFDKIVENRNLTLDYIRKHTGYTHVLFVDSDIFPPPNTIEKFLKRNLDIQCGLCFVAHSVHAKRPACNFFEDDIKSGKAEEWVKEKKPEPVKIAQNGMGCMMIKADILRKHSTLKFYNKQIEKEGKKVLNEDLTFTGNLRELGHDLWLDVKDECYHDMRGRM